MSHVNPHRRWQLQLRLPSTQLSGIIYVTDDVRSLPLQLKMSYKAEYGQRRCNDTAMITDFFRLLMGRVQEVKQRL
jgi:hypothetical protein